FPGGGWSQISEREVTLPLGAAAEGGLAANLVLIETGGQQYDLLYLYEVRGVAIASDHGYRARLLYNRLVWGRSDGALIRIASPVQAGEEEHGVLASRD